MSLDQEPDLNGGPAITSYRVYYRKEPHGRWTRFSDRVTGDSTTITGLTAHTAYQVRVRARNGERDSDWSDPSDTVSTAGPTCTLNPGRRLVRGRHGRECHVALVMDTCLPSPTRTYRSPK